MYKWLLRGFIFLGWLAGTWTAGSGQDRGSLTWDFPLPRVHTGMLLGNGQQGLMIWGQGNQLHITVAQAGFWDHRGGNEFTTRITYPALEAMLMDRDDEAIQQAFAIPEADRGGFGHPQQLGGARITVTFPEGWTIQRGILYLTRGEIDLLAHRGAETVFMTLQQDPYSNWADLHLPEELAGSRVSLTTAYELNQAAYQQAGIDPPRVKTSRDREQQVAWQPLPQDKGLQVGFRHAGSSVSIWTRLGSERIPEPPLAGWRKAAFDWWQAYWSSVPTIGLPDSVLQEIHDYGLYKQACATPPQGEACSLQGPFMEDYQIVPWSNDYHFNINLEMIYYPALMSGRFEHLQPLWEMLHAWWKTLEENGETFFGQEGAMMLPHAVDDRGQVVGTFWTGTIDHACTAWMAQLAWLHYAYSGDTTVLQKTAYPLLRGAFEGYWAMLEREENGTFYLPVSVSPEYRGARMDAWGRDASFQLAALHAMCDLLPQAAAVLGKEPDPRWAEVAAHLPPYTTFTGVFQQEWNISNTRIALWEGMDLVESHRHHSHLGAIWPFVTIDPLAEEHADIVANSLATWRYRGAGGWSGWCVPWAAILMARTNQGEAAVNWLHYWRDNFVNTGRGTLHNANTQGHSFLAHPVWEKQPEQPIGEIMQLDAGFGALIAVYELLVQARQDGIHVFPGASVFWDRARFAGIWTPGGFVIGSNIDHGEVQEVSIKATRAGHLRLHPQLGTAFLVNGQRHEGAVFEVDASPGQVWVLSRE